jgi:long-subunit fatty acid transport protein
VFNAIEPAPVDSLPLEWHDSFTVRAGAEMYLGENDTLRAGYIYMTNPVPDRTLTPIITGNLQHAVSIGYGHRFGGLSIDAAYQFSWGPRQEVDDSEVADEYDDSSLKVMAHWFFLGASYRF